MQCDFQIHRRDDILEDMRKAGDAASQRQRAAEEAAARAKAQQSLNALNLQSQDRPPQPYSAQPHNYPPPQQVGARFFLSLFPALREEEHVDLCMRKSTCFLEPCFSML